MSTATAVKPKPKPKTAKPKRALRKAPIVEFEIRRDDLCEVLADAALFADRGNYLPMLEAVHLYVSHDGRIVATGTNRYVAGRRTFNLVGSVGRESVEVLLPLSEVAAIAKIHARARRGVENFLKIAISGSLLADKRAELAAVPGWVEVTSGSDETRWTRSRHACQPYEWPNIDRMIHDALNRPADTSFEMRFDMDYLSLFAKVSRRYNESVSWHPTSPSTGMAVKIGEHFTGLIMPRRQPAEAAA